MRRAKSIGIGSLLWLCASCSGGGGGGPSSQSPAAPEPALSPAAALGEKIFADTSLSASGRLACASCHDPKHDYAAPNGAAVQLGGPNLDQPGLRAVPSLKYKERTPSFFADPGPESPLGGFDWDGRALTLQAQPAFPLLAPNEMANASAAAVIARLINAPYAGDFAKVFGATIFSDPEVALQKVGFALASYQLEDADFHPYDSKYDAYLAGKVALTEQEQRGLALFDDPAVGCAGCHLDKIGADGLAGSSPVFTDYEFEALGVPRNDALAANADPAFFDVGICGPLRTDAIAQKGRYCGMFKTPTLRNVANRQAFFHNGRFGMLKDTLHFYVERDTDPAKWYLLNADGSVEKFDDLPLAYQANVDVIDPPFDRAIGGQPALNDAQIEDVIAFLQTLNDGYQIPTQ